MTKFISDWQVGASVAVKSGVKDPDTGDDIGGWQGRITEFSKDKDGTPTICFAWDSLSLKSMSAESLKYAIREGLDWQVMGLYESDLVAAQPRDTEDDVADAIAEIESHTSWLHLDEEGERIQAVLDGIEPDDAMALLEAWEEYFDKTLKFPFEAFVSECMMRSRVRVGDRLLVTGFADLDDEMYGLLIEGKHEREHIVFPLCDLEVIDKKSRNYQPVKDYVVWFANR